MGCCAGSAEKRYESELLQAERAEKELLREISEEQNRLTELQDGGRRDGPAGILEQLEAELLKAEAHRDEIPCELAELRRRNEELHNTLEEEHYEEFMRQSSSPAVGSRADPSSAEIARLASERECANATHRYREDALSSEKHLVSLQEQLTSLRQDLARAALDLQDAQTKSQVEGSGQDSTVTISLQRLLSEKRSDYERSEQRWDDTEKLLHEQMRELRNELSIQEQKLRKQDGDLQSRDKELTEVNSNLGNLQSLFDDVNHQLLNECGRIEELQETVALCAKQGKELQSLQSMLEESHRVLAQMRDALEVERSERAKAAESLEQEQQRTQLLLDVLKHFKEKLQGLTPQMLLSRLNVEPKAGNMLVDNDQHLNSDFSKPLLQRTVNGSGNDAYSDGRRTPSTSGRSFAFAEASRHSRAGALISPRYALNNGIGSAARSPAMTPEGSSFPNLMHGQPEYTSFRTLPPTNTQSSPFPASMQVNGSMMPVYSGGLLRK